MFDVFDDVFVDDGDGDDDVERGIKFCLFCLIQELIKRELKLKQLITRSKLKVNKEYKKSSVNEGCVYVYGVWFFFVSNGMRRACVGVFGYLSLY